MRYRQACLPGNVQVWPAFFASSRILKSPPALQAPYHWRYRGLLHQATINREALAAFFLFLEIADFDDMAAEAYGTVRALLEKAGTSVGSMDMLIGAHALSLNLTLVTNNVREFKQVKNLKVVDWRV
jgi:predicted nucleic acid-binding protein